MTFFLLDANFVQKNLPKKKKTSIHLYTKCCIRQRAYSQVFATCFPDYRQLLHGIILIKYAFTCGTEFYSFEILRSHKSQVGLALFDRAECFHNLDRRRRHRHFPSPCNPRNGHRLRTHVNTTLAFVQNPFFSLLHLFTCTKKPLIQLKQSLMVKHYAIFLPSIISYSVRSRYLETSQ